MNFLTTNRRVVYSAASVLAGIGAVIVLPQMAGAQTGGAKPHGQGVLGGIGSAQRVQLQRMQQARQKMIADLHITPDQQAKLKKAQREQRNMGSKMMAIYNNKSLTDDQKKQQMTDMSVKSRAQINAIFTPEQRAKYKAMQQATMQAHMKQMQAAGGATTKPSH